jgi:hypothetical protein
MNNAVASVAVVIVSTLALVTATPTVAQMDMSCPHRRVPDPNSSGAGRALSLLTSHFSLF